MNQLETADNWTSILKSYEPTTQETLIKNKAFVYAHILSERTKLAVVAINACKIIDNGALADSLLPALLKVTEKTNKVMVNAAHEMTLILVTKCQHVPHPVLMENLKNPSKTARFTVLSALHAIAHYLDVPALQKAISIGILDASSNIRDLARALFTIYSSIHASTLSSFIDGLDDTSRKYLNVKATNLSNLDQSRTPAKQIIASRAASPIKQQSTISSFAAKTTQVKTIPSTSSQSTLVSTLGGPRKVAEVKQVTATVSRALKVPRPQTAPEAVSEVIVNQTSIVESVKPRTVQPIQPQITAHPRISTTARPRTAVSTQPRTVAQPRKEIKSKINTNLHPVNARSRRDNVSSKFVEEAIQSIDAESSEFKDHSMKSSHSASTDTLIPIDDEQTVVSVSDLKDAIALLDSVDSKTRMDAFMRCKGSVEESREMLRDDALGELKMRIMEALCHQCNESIDNIVDIQ